MAYDSPWEWEKGTSLEGKENKEIFVLFKGQYWPLRMRERERDEKKQYRWGNIRKEREIIEYCNWPK